MQRQIVTCCAVLSILSAGLSGQQTARSGDVKLPPPFHSPSVNNRPQVIERPDGARLRVPAGFTVEEFASDVFTRPRTMIYAPGGEILIADSDKGGGVYLLADKQGRPVPPSQRKRILGGLDRPYGMAFWKDYLYVAETTSLKRYKFDAAKLEAGPGEEIVSMKDFGAGHWTRTITFDPKGQKLYLGIGSQSNVSAGENPMRAAIHEYNPDGTGHQFFATGTRNPTTIRFYPGTNTLWASVQERDELGDDLVPDYFTHIERGGFYGWPYAYIGPNEDPRRKGERPDLVKKTIVPDVLLGPHVAVIDWVFYQGKMFPERYRGGAFLAFHGSWNRSKRIGYSVAFVPFKDGKPTQRHAETFLEGWMISPDSREVWGRPTGVLEMRDGSLLVSDDGGRKVWRISYKR